MLLEEPLLLAVEPPDDMTPVPAAAAATAAGAPSLATQIKFLALKNLAGSLAAVRSRVLHCSDSQAARANCVISSALSATMWPELMQADADAASDTLQSGAALKALQLYAQAALLDAGDIVLWNRMGVLVRNFVCTLGHQTSFVCIQRGPSAVCSLHPAV